MRGLALLAISSALSMVYPPPPEHIKADVPLIPAAKQIKPATPTTTNLTILKDLEKLEAVQAPPAQKKINTRPAASNNGPKSEIKSYVQSEAAKIGWTGIYWDALDFIISHESGWNHLVVNKSSGACSLFQALPCSKIPGDWQDIKNQIVFGFQYIKSRYGSPLGAKEFWERKRWY